MTALVFLAAAAGTGIVSTDSHTEVCTSGGAASTSPAPHVLANVSTVAMLTNVNTSGMLTSVNIPTMAKSLNSAAVGALVRHARTAAGMTQTELAERIGASRFWVAAFEKGKSSAELGLALKAIHAVGLAMRIEPQSASERPDAPTAQRANTRDTQLARVIAHTTLTRTAPSSVAGWPTTSASPGSSRSRKQ